MKIRTFRVEGLRNIGEIQLDFGTENALHIIYGPNEAGKSTLLAALIDWLFGGKIPSSSLYDSGTVLAGELDHPDLPAFSFARRRKRNDLVLSGEDRGMEETLLASYLSGYPKEKYTLLFGFDHERLRQGGESLLSSGGHAGISLFESGEGIQFLQKVLEELDEEVNNLLQPRFPKNSAKRLNRAWRNYTELEGKVRQAGLSASLWMEKKREIDNLERTLENDRKELEDLNRAISKLERIRRVSRLLRERREILETLSGMEKIPLIPASTCERITDLFLKFREANRDLHKITLDMDTVREKINKLIIDESLLSLEGQIRHLYENLRQYIFRKEKELPQEKLQFEDRNHRVLQLLHSLAPEKEVAEAEQLRIPYEDEEAILILAEEMIEAKKNKNHIRERLAEEKAKWLAALNELGQLPERKDPSELKNLLSRYRNAGNIEDRIHYLKTERDRIRNRLKELEGGQRIWRRPAEEIPSTPLPLMETVERYIEEWKALGNDSQNAEREKKQAEDSLRNIQFEIRQLEIGGQIPLETDLEQARRHRDDGWELVKRVWLNQESERDVASRYTNGRPLSEVFEQSMAEADRISDLLRKESGRVARRASLLLEQKRLGEIIDAANSRLQSLDDRRKNLLTRFRSEWPEEGIDVKSPAEMKAWLQSFVQPVKSEWSRLKEVELNLREAIRSRDEWMEKLVQAARNSGLSVQEEGGFGSLLEAVDAFVSKTEDQIRSREDLSRRIAELEQGVIIWKQKLQDAEEKIKEKESQWRKWRSRFPGLPESAGIAPKYIEQLRLMFQLLDERNRIQKGIREKEEFCRHFEQEALELAGTLRMGEIQSAKDFILSVWNQYEEEKEKRTGRKELEKRLEELSEQRIKTEILVQELAAELESFRNQYLVSTADELLPIVERSREKADLLERKIRLEQEIAESGDGLPFEILEEEVREYPDLSLLQDLIREKGEEREHLSQKIQENQQNLGRLKQEFEKWDGSQADAARLAQKAESYLAEVDDCWNEYVRKELARRLLIRSIESFREKNESAILKKASAYFRDLTLGHYTELRVDYEGNVPFLEACRSDGSRRRVPEMSEGTRDQLYLSLRLAFIDRHMEESQPLPILLDDILVTFDDDRSMATLETLIKLSEKTQILYFTHHQFIVEAARQFRQGRMKVYTLGTGARVG